MECVNACATSRPWQGLYRDVPFTIEPGVYVEGLGGFRHSDTVVVTPDGIDILTDYPTDIESLTIPL